MKCAAKITSKGQITVPKEIRRALGVSTGDSVVFERDGDAIRVLPKRPAASPFERFRGIDPGIPGGIESIVSHVREMRGHDADEEKWERAYELRGKKSAAKGA